MHFCKLLADLVPFETSMIYRLKPSGSHLDSYTQNISTLFF